MTDSTALECIDVSVDYGSFRAVDGVSFSLKSGQITALLGPSGCGKSTLLRAIAGLERPQQGDIQWNGQSILRIPTYRRGFGLMFQDGQLFRIAVSKEMSATACVAFPLLSVLRVL